MRRKLVRRNVVEDLPEVKLDFSEPKKANPKKLVRKNAVDEIPEVEIRHYVSPNKEPEPESEDSVK